MQGRRQRLVGIQGARLDNQALGESGEQAPVAPRVGVSQSRAAHRCAEAGVVELGGTGCKAGLEITQTLAAGKLGEGHRAVVLAAAQPAHEAVTLVARHDPGECFPG